MKDAIVEEIHAIREEISREAGHDPQRILEAARLRQKDSAKAHQIVTLPPKRIAPARKAS